MKIAIVSPWAVNRTSVGGTERFIMDLAESFVKLGDTIDVLTFSGDTYQHNGVNYQTLDLFGPGTIVDEYVLRKKLGDFSQAESYKMLASTIEKKVDTCVYDALFISTQLLLEAWKEKRRIFTIHTNPFEYRQAWGDNSYQMMIKLAQDQDSTKTIFTAPSDFYADFFSSEIKLPVEAIPHAIQQQRLAPTASRNQIEKHYALHSDKLRILLPSRLEPVQKRPGLLFEALSLLPQNITNKIEVVASGVDVQYEQYQKKYKEQAATKGYPVLFERFEFMEDAYLVADVVVLPSQSESFGYAALESLTLGIPTILSDIPTFHELGDDHPSALFFQESAESLAKVLADVVTYPRQRSAPATWRHRYNLKGWGNKYRNLV